jgi:hypothetical protein
LELPSFAFAWKAGNHGKSQSGNFVLENAHVKLNHGISFPNNTPRSESEEIFSYTSTGKHNQESLSLNWGNRVSLVILKNILTEEHDLKL